MDLIERIWFVPGVPVPKGSGEGTEAQRNNRKRAAWRENLELALLRVRLRELWRGPVGVSAVFWLEGDLVEPPDADKLLRFVLDEFKGAFYADDAQVISAPPALAGAERSPHGPGASFRVRPLPDDRRPHGDAMTWAELETWNALPELVGR